MALGLQISFLVPDAAVGASLLSNGCCPPASSCWSSEHLASYSSLAGSMVPLLHINAKCQAWNRASRYSLPHPPYKQNVTQFSANSCSIAIHNLLKIWHRYKHFHTLSQRQQSANTFLWLRVASDLIRTGRRRRILNNQTSSDAPFFPHSVPTIFLSTNYNVRNQNNNDRMGITSAWHWGIILIELNYFWHLWEMGCHNYNSIILSSKKDLLKSFDLKSGNWPNLGTRTCTSNVAVGHFPFPDLEYSTQTNKNFKDALQYFFSFTQLLRAAVSVTIIYSTHFKIT